MSQTRVLDASSRTHTGAKRLNGIVWGLLLLTGLAVAATSGSYAALLPLMALLLLSGAGVAANLALLCWKTATGRFRQALGYGLGFVLLTVFFFWLYHYLGSLHIGKISG